MQSPHATAPGGRIYRAVSLYTVLEDWDEARTRARRRTGPLPELSTRHRVALHSEYGDATHPLPEARPNPTRGDAT